MVHYIGWYIANDDKEKYSGNVPGNLKMHYVVEMLKQAGKRVAVLSLADRNKSIIYFPQRRILTDETSICYVGGIYNGKKVFKKLNSFLKKIQFICYVLFYVKKDDAILLYHSLEYTKFLSKIKSIAKRKVIIEVEEIYGYSAIEDKPWVNEEISAIKKMDYFITVNDGMIVSLDLPADKSVANYGVGIIPCRNVERINDGKIHVVYAGTIENKKRGAFMAAETARFLSNDYHLHIIGFGKEKDIDALKSLIEVINRDADYWRVTYDGFFSGKELDDFLFKCHIGLSSNVMRPNFANNSFPSKVITYMCHDLSIVLGYANAFYDVPISKGWQFYHNYEPKEVADAITRTEVKPIGAYHAQINRMNEDLLSFLKRYC